MSPLKVVDDSFQQLPQVARAIAIVGVPSAIAMFLVFFLCTTVTSAMRESLMDHAKMQDRVTQLKTEFEIFDRTQSDTNQKLVQFALVGCIHGAKNDTERNECLSVMSQKLIGGR